MFVARRDICGMMAGFVLGVAGLLAPAGAGPHANGKLVPHIDATIEYTTSVSSYEGQCDIRDCEDAVTEGQVNSEKAQVWFVLACFADSPGPVDLAGIEFGLGSFDPSKINFVAYGATDPLLELPTSGWPGPNEGIAIAWGTDKARTSRVAEVYWFASYVYGPVAVELSVDPTYDIAQFGDSNLPPQMDDIFDFGIAGFGQPGYNPCAPPGPQTGACCVWGECRLVSRDECEAQGGSYRGDNTVCFPSPCGDAIETSWGALKRLYD